MTAGLLVRGGRVVDPAAGRDGVADLLLADGVVAEVGERLSAGGYVADTPGFREFMPVDLEPAEVGRHYTEFRRAMDGKPCRFSDCLHGPEPGCSVLAALAGGRISKLRYENYLQILSSLGRSPGSRRVL